MDNVQSDVGVLSTIETQDLAALKAILEHAIADGKISRQEMDSIRAAVFADGKMSIEEAELYRTFIIEKFKRGELEIES
ncbi:MAG TPA: hypothetical protein V6C64_00315 [Microcoleaceae cyanobacterium]|jgi:uncharacterized membrane protein YebE (DUF533 family)